MVSINLFEFQQEAVQRLLNLTSSIYTKQSIVVKAPTGAGKTIMLIDYIDEFLESNPNTAFVWLCPGKGDLEEQSRQKMLKFAPGRNAQTLEDALTGGFSECSTTFINWEKITKKDNNAIKDAEKQNLFDRINKAAMEGISFVIIIDEEHQNNTAKAAYIIDAFNAKHIVRVSATTSASPNSEFFEINENEVIDSGLITKAIYVNDEIEDDPEEDEGIDLLLEMADAKRKQIFDEYSKLNKTIRPLVLVQFPNGKPETIEEVENKLRSMGYTRDNGMVSVWMSEDKRNLDPEVVENDGTPIFLLMKQAISTGWDCPRAKILVKLREGMSEQFTTQTIGRIRRMPEARHYENEILDCCYVYTFDQEFKAGIFSNIEKSYEQKLLKLKDKCKTFTLTRENRDLDYVGLGEREMCERVYNYFKTAYDLSDDKEHNKVKLSNENLYLFGNKLYGRMLKGRFVFLSEMENNIGGDFVQTQATVNTHTHGIRMLHVCNELKTILSLQQHNVRTILERIFLNEGQSKYKLLELDRDEFYAFVINNEHQLKADCEALASDMLKSQQTTLGLNIKEDTFSIPEEDLFRYDPTVKKEIDYLSNAYEKYTSGFCTKKVRSNSEREFEKYCESNDSVDWVYKNGDSGQNYLSIVYLTAAGKQRLFYPDYIVKLKDESVWLVEAKGGEDKDGKTQNIDKYAGIKFNHLRDYAAKHGLNFGFVREYDSDVYFCNTEYHEEMSDEHWVPIENIF